MNKEIKHDELKQAFEQGAKVQKFMPCGTDENLEGGVWLTTHNPQWEENVEYRIKPKEPVVRWLWAWVPKEFPTGGWHMCGSFMTEVEAQAYFSMHSNGCYKKLEWSREEFDE
jgi:hypothetical protein